ncbi:MAG: hypothetical protein RLZZ568_758 [Cyanobacteriota bacterium]|jgi:hypothetical protein
MDTSVSVFAEIPEDLHQSLTTYLEKHPHWDLDRVFSAALSLFLLQNSGGFSTQQTSPHYKACARVYLETLFQTAD